MNPRLKYILVLLPFWVIPLLLLYLSTIAGNNQTLEGWLGKLYLAGLVGPGPISVGAVIATVVGLLCSLVEALRKDIIYALVGFLAPFTAFTSACGSSCASGGMQAYVQMFLVTLIPGLVLGFITWKFHP
jgi:hypothetical protein